MLALARGLAVLHGIVETLLVVLDSLVFLLQLFLQLLDVILKCLLSFLVLGFQRQNLVVDVRCLHIIPSGMLIRVNSLVLELEDLVFHGGDLTVGRLQFQPHNVDLVVEFVVFANGFVEQKLLILQSMGQ